MSNELTAYQEAKETAEAAKVALEQRAEELKQELVAIRVQLGRKPRAAKKPRPALGPGLKKDGTARKLRGPNKVKPTVTGIEASEQA